MFCRLTSIQKQGLYDLFNEKFAKHVAGSNNTAARKKREAEGGGSVQLIEFSRNTQSW